MRWALAPLLAACGGSFGPPEITCNAGSTFSGALAAGGMITVPDGTGDDLAGAAVAAQAKTTPPAGQVTIKCAPDIALPGTVTLGPAVSFSPDGAASDRPFLITLPYKAARLPADAGKRHVRILVKRGKGDGTAFFANVSNLTIGPDRVTFAAEELATYQAVAPGGAGTATTRHYTFRAIAGASMGGGAAIAMASRHPERWDLVGELGGEPGPDILYTLGMVGDYLFGGFCAPPPGICISQQRRSWSDQMEIHSDYEHMPSQSGQGIGLTLNRSLYIKASRDLSRALGNPTLYNPASPYLPPGVPASFLLQTDKCTNPVILHGFKDAKFNPDGSKDVITFCDGGDKPGMLGVFDPTQPQTNAAEVLLAVDLNGNHVRDAGEPVIAQPYEPFSDVGSDGLADAQEPGYDPVTNPDPHGDDFHPIRNPRGTEGNFFRDPGEPFVDYGLDGVNGTGDAGEGNGYWDVNPNLFRWVENDGARNLIGAPPEQRERLHIYVDAGIRDFFNGHVSANSMVGKLLAFTNMPFGVYDGFHALTGVAAEFQYDFQAVPWAELPENVYIRYGDPDATAAVIDSGDGRHVGTTQQLVNRVTTVFSWISASWPEGDRAPADATANDMIQGQFTSPSTGRMTPYAVSLPPGYALNPQLRYPVVYFLHGYGMDPQSLIQIAGVFASYMGDSKVPEAKRLQKMIIVFVDGACRAGDGCETGTFYMNSPVNRQAQMENILYELTAEIDRLYRTKAAADVTLTP